VTVNGQPGLAMYRDATLYNVVSLDVAGDLIQGVHIVVNPDKLRVSAPESV
jgi:hypothetical protein